MRKFTTPIFPLSLIFPFLVNALHAQDSAKITGTVYNESGEAIPNANVALKNPDDNSIITGTVTDNSGTFSITSDPGTYALLISYIAYRDYTAEIVLGTETTVTLVKLSSLPKIHSLMKWWLKASARIWK